MSNGPSSLSKLLRLLGAAVLLSAAGAAFADEYGEVNELLRSGRAAEALDRAEQYLATRPRDPQMRFIRGVILSESGRSTEAIGAFTRLIEDYPELPEPYNNLAVLHAQQGQLDKARAALEMAVRTHPGYATAHENLGDIYAQLAGRAYGRAAELDPSNQALRPKLALVRQLFAPKAAPAPAGKPASKPAASPTR